MTEQIPSPESESRESMNGSAARLAYATVDTKLARPDQTTVTTEQRNQLKSASVDKLDHVIEAGNKVSYEERQAAEQLSNKNWNESMWNVVQRMTADSVNDNLKDERTKAFDVLGIKLDRTDTDADGLHTDIENFRIKYVDYSGSDIKSFIIDLSTDLTNDKGVVDMDALHKRLIAIKPLLGAFGQKDGQALVTDFATVRAMLTQDADVKARLVDQAAAKVGAPITGDEKARVMKVYDKLDKTVKTTDETDTTPRPPDPPAGTEGERNRNEANENNGNKTRTEPPPPDPLDNTSGDTNRNEGNNNNDSETDTNDKLTDEEVALAHKYLLNADVPDEHGNLPTLEESKQKLERDSLLRIYTKELAEVFDKYGEEELVEHFEEGKEALKECLSDINIESTQFRQELDSPTWYFFSMIHERYLANHPDARVISEESREYVDPFLHNDDSVSATEADKSQYAEEQIWYAQLGEELYLYNETAGDLLDKLPDTTKPATKDKIKSILDKQEFPSIKELEVLGDAIDRILNDNEEPEPILDREDKILINDPKDAGRVVDQITTAMLQTTENEEVFISKPEYILPLIKYELAESFGHDDLQLEIADTPDGSEQQLRIFGAIDSNREASADVNILYSNDEDGKLVMMPDNSTIDVYNGKIPGAELLFKRKVRQTLSQIDSLIKSHINERLKLKDPELTVDQLQVGEDGLIWNVKRLQP